MDKVPEHVAIILDGNGRWAAAHGKSRSQGHLAGADNVETISDALIERGVRYLTVYAFSTENWKRSEEEVSYLMGLLKTYLIRNKKDAIRRHIRIRVIGDRSRLSEELQALVKDVEESTKPFDSFNLTFAISYGSRDELARAMRAIAGEVREGLLKPEDITEATVQAHLDTAELPDPDLMIRTSGEQRLSNFLLWQLAYAEFAFSPQYWPEFSVGELDRILQDYAGRSRRFGGRLE